MIKYGLISETDARVLEKTIDLICDEFPNEILRTLEIGVYGGDTGRGICEYIKSKGINYWITGIDSFKDKEVVRFPYNEMVYGNSSEVYNQIEDNSQHLIFIDGDHSFLGVISDFYAYAPKVKVGGFFAFHDTGKHIKSFTDFQHGDESNPDAYISVRKALEAVGLFSVIDAKTSKKYSLNGEWELIFDDADPNDRAGGICVFKKLH